MVPSFAISHGAFVQVPPHRNLYRGCRCDDRHFGVYHRYFVGDHHRQPGNKKYGGGDDHRYFEKHRGRYVEDNHRYSGDLDHSALEKYHRRRC